MENKVFFPQAALDQWTVDEVVEFQGGVLTILAEGRRYHLEEGVLVLREVSGAADDRDLVGRVKLRSRLDELGAEIIESSMLLGEGAYDIEAGWVGLPVGRFAQHEASEARKKASSAGQAERARRQGPPPRTDEELLLRFLTGTLTEVADSART